MKSELYRKEAMKQVASPDKLNDYISVAAPSTWIFLGAILIFLAGICIWGVTGRMDTTVKCSAIVEQGEVTCYVKEADLTEVKEGMEVKIEDKTCKVQKVDVKEPVKKAQTQENTSVYRVDAGKTDLTDGAYQASIVVESISPIKFIFN